MILVHNHPSGDPTPSKKDLVVTETLRNSAKILNIELLDHIIIGNMSYMSIMQYKIRQNNSWERKVDNGFIYIWN